MGLAPLPNALDMVGSSEVVTVFGFAQPAALTGGFTGFATGRL